MKIGNIIFEKELVNHEKVDYINYINESVEYKKNDNRFPTLYVGWLFMKKCNQYDNSFSNIDILNNEIISDNLYWEYSFEENKSSHIKGVENFVNLVPQYYFSSKYEYEIIDPVFNQIKTIDDLNQKLPNNIDSIYNYKNEFIYMLVNNKILGLDLKMFEFFKFDIENIIINLSKKIINSSVIYVDYDGSVFQKYYKLFPKFSQLKRYIITILHNII